MIDLSKLLCITFEIGNDCDLQDVHKLCPINQRVYKKESQCLDTDCIEKIVKQAKELNFDGYIAFHYYNEPLLHRDRIEKVMDRLSDFKFALWSNGLLIDRNLEHDPFLDRFDFMVFTCYKQSDKPFFVKLKEEYKKVIVFDADFDDRLKIYDYDKNNVVGCKRPLLELPIDYYGNLHLCCYDWNTEYEIGNVFERDFKEIICDDNYQRTLKMTQNRMLDLSDCPETCKQCKHLTIAYSKEHYLNMFDH
jgi:radical SAM protein with 4Fe4S-binding SPASM domain